MSKKFRDRLVSATKSTVLIGAFTVFLAWATYSTLTAAPLKLGRVLFGALLGAGALWNGYLFVMMLVALYRMKKDVLSAEK
jgi:hypothetical protein